MNFELILYITSFPRYIYLSYALVLHQGFLWSQAREGAYLHILKENLLIKALHHITTS